MVVTARVQPAVVATVRDRGDAQPAREEGKGEPQGLNGPASSGPAGAHLGSLLHPDFQAVHCFAIRDVKLQVRAKTVLRTAKRLGGLDMLN